MKTTIITLLLLFAAFHLKAQIVTPPVVPNSTNTDYTTNSSTLQINSLASSIGALRASLNDERARTDVLQQKMTRLETGFLVMAIVFVITVVAMCFLNAKNRPAMTRYLTEQRPNIPGR